MLSLEKKLRRAARCQHLPLTCGTGYKQHRYFLCWLSLKMTVIKFMLHWLTPQYIPLSEASFALSLMIVASWHNSTPLSRAFKKLSPVKWVIPSTNNLDIIASLLSKYKHVYVQVRLLKIYFHFTFINTSFISI